MTTPKRPIVFSPEERKRIAEHARALRTSQAELLQGCGRQGLDELYGYARDAVLLRSHYEEGK